MPSWKIHYGEEDRWKLVHYIRTMFTQTEERPSAPPEGEDFTYPDFYKESVRWPDATSFVRGKKTFLMHCAHCHGLAGDGQGWDGQYLDPTPADFRGMASKQMTPEAQGEHIAKVTFGIQDTAMPYWGEFLPWQDRWDAIKFLMGAWMGGTPSNSSVYDSGQVPANYVTVSSQVYLDEGHTISPTHGIDLYSQYCATCHGSQGQGDGPGNEGSASGGPAPFPSDMGEGYIYWRIWEGVPDSIMPPFQWLISGNDVWDITVYMRQSLTGSGGGS